MTVRLKQGRSEASKIIAMMADKGVAVELFGSMKRGNVLPNSDVDLLTTDCGKWRLAHILYEIKLAERHIEFDVIFAAHTGTSSRSGRWTD